MCPRHGIPLAVAAVTLWSAGAQAGGEADWIRVRSPHFEVVSDAGAASARRVAHQFEQIRGLFETVKNARVDPGRPIVVFAAKDETSLRALLPGAWERKGGARPAGVFVRGSDRNCVVLRVDVSGVGAYRVLYHEYVHMLVDLNLPRLPVWLNEGLAEFYASADIDEHRATWGRISPPQVLLLRSKGLLPLDTLLSADQSSPYYNESDRATIFYAQAAVLVHYLMLGPPGKQQPLVRFLKLLDEGKEEHAALVEAFGDLKALEKDVGSYVRRFAFDGILSPAQIGAEPLASEPLSPAEAASLRGDLMRRTGRAGDARALLEEALRLDPKLAPAHVAMGFYHLRWGALDAAERAFATAAALSPEDPIAHYGMALALRSADAETLARKEKALRRTVELSPAFGPAYGELVVLLGERGDWSDETLRLARRASALEPSSLSRRLMLARVLRKGGKTAEADRLEQLVLEASSSNPASLAEVVAFFGDEGRTADAEAALRRGQSARPGSAAVALQLGTFLRQQKRDDEAETALRAGLAADPENPALLNALAYSNAERGVHLEEALKLVERALARVPDNALFQDSKGWVLFRLKRFREAEEWLRKAAERSDHPDIHSHLGDVLGERGAWKEALEQWQQAASRARDADQKASLEGKIQQAQTRLGAAAP